MSSIFKSLLLAAALGSLVTACGPAYDQDSLVAGSNDQADPAQVGKLKKALLTTGLKAALIRNAERANQLAPKKDKVKIKNKFFSYQADAEYRVTYPDPTANLQLEITDARVFSGDRFEFTIVVRSPIEGQAKVENVAQVSASAEVRIEAKAAIRLASERADDVAFSRFENVAAEVSKFQFASDVLNKLGAAKLAEDRLNQSWREQKDEVLRDLNVQVERDVNQNAAQKRDIARILRLLGIR